MSPEEQTDLADFIEVAPAMARAAHAGHGTGEPEGALARYQLPATLEHIHCILWEGQYFMTSYDIIKLLRVLVHAGGHGQADRKFEESVFSVLRRYRPGLECQVELAHSRLLLWLQRHGCIRTIKKQKMYYWHKVDVFKLANEIRHRIIRRPALLLTAAESVASDQRLGPSTARSNASTADDSALLRLAEAALELEAEPKHTNAIQPNSSHNYASQGTATRSYPTASSEAKFDPRRRSLAERLHPDGPRRRYLCLECEDKFLRSEHLKRHGTTHFEND